MEGAFNHAPEDLPLEEYRTWRLCTLLHCRPSDLEGESAVSLDWLLAVDDSVARARKNMQEAAQNG